MDRPKTCLAVLAAATSLAAGPVAGVELRDLHFGEALFDGRIGLPEAIDAGAPVSS